MVRQHPRIGKYALQTLSCITSSKNRFSHLNNYFHSKLVKRQKHSFFEARFITEASVDQPREGVLHKMLTSEVGMREIL